MKRYLHHLVKQSYQNHHGFYLPCLAALLRPEDYVIATTGEKSMILLIQAH